MVQPTSLCPTGSCTDSEGELARRMPFPLYTEGDRLRHMPLPLQPSWLKERVLPVRLGSTFLLLLCGLAAGNGLLDTSPSHRHGRSAESCMANAVLSHLGSDLVYNLGEDIADPAG